MDKKKRCLSGTTKMSSSQSLPYSESYSNLTLNKKFKYFSKRMKTKLKKKNLYF